MDLTVGIHGDHQEKNTDPYINEPNIFSFGTAEAGARAQRAVLTYAVVLNQAVTYAGYASDAAATATAERAGAGTDPDAFVRGAS